MWNVCKPSVSISKLKVLKSVYLQLTRPQALPNVNATFYFFYILWLEGYYPQWHCPSPLQVPTSHMKPKEQTTQRTRTRPSSTPRAATPTRKKRKSTTSNQSRNPRTGPLSDTRLFLGGGAWGEGGRCRVSGGIRVSESSEGWRVLNMVPSRCLV